MPSDPVERAALVLWPVVFALGLLIGLGWFTSFLLATTTLTVLFAGGTVYQSIQFRRELRR